MPSHVPHTVITGFGNWLESLRSDLDTLVRSVETPEESVPRLQEGERREVAILFLDFEGFSQLSEMLDPEDVHLIVDRTFKIFTQSIEQYRGYVDKYEGDALLALFGCREAGEDDAIRAVHSGCDILEKLASINQILAPRDIALTIRIGIHTGLVRTGKIGKEREGDFTVLGDAVNLTRRIQELAPPNGILISREVQDVVGDIFLLENQGVKAVKGRDESVEVYQIQGINPDRRQRWERATMLARSCYVGRDREASRLRKKYRNARSGGKHHMVLLVTGPPGIGKSRFVHEFLVEVQGGTATRTLVLKGQTPRYSTEPFGLFTSLIRSFFGESDGGARFREGMDGLLSALDGQLQSELTHAQPVLESLLGYSEPPPRFNQLTPLARRLEITLAITTWLEAAAQRAYKEYGNPLVLALDDLQWVDNASSDTLDFVLSRLTTSLPCLFLLASRPEVKLPATVQQYKGFQQISITALHDEDIKHMLESMISPGKWPDHWMKELLLHAGGNPLFAEELAQSFADRGHISENIAEDAPWPNDMVVPRTVQGLILSRVDCLPRDTKEIIQVASVVGKEIPKSVLTQILEQMGYKQEAIGSRLKDLVRRDLLRPLDNHGESDYWSFSHVLIQETVNSMVLNVNKRVIHRLTGEALETMEQDFPKHAAVLAYHFLGAGETEKALGYLLDAIKEAMVRGDYREGIRLADQGLAFIDIHDSTGKLPKWMGKLHLERAGLLNIQGDWDQLQISAEKALEIAQGLGDNAMSSGTLNVLFWGYLGRGKLEKAGEIALDALEEARAGGVRLEEARSLTNIAVVEFHRGDMKAALDPFEQALAIFEEENDLLGVAGVLSSMSGVYHHLGDEEHALRALERSINLRKDLGDHSGQVKSLNNIGIVLRTLGCWTEAHDRFQSALDLAQRIGDRTGEATALMNRGTMNALEENYVEALDDLNQSLKLFMELGYRAGEGETLKELGKVHLCMGHTDLAWDHLQLARECRRSLGQKLEEMEILAWLARTALEQGREEQALHMSSEAAEFVKGRAGVEEAPEIFYQRYLILDRVDQDGNEDFLMEVLGEARRVVIDRADSIKDPKLHQCFLESVPTHREILVAWNRRT